MAYVEPNLDFILQPDETLVWEGEPIHPHRSAFAHLVMGAFALALGLFMLMMKVERTRDGRFDPMARPQQILMVAAGVYATVRGLWGAALPPPLYLLTNRRAVACTPRLFRSPSIRSFGPERIFVREEPEGSGDLRFAARITGDLGFHGIADVRHVELLARTTVEGQPSGASTPMRRLYPTPEADLEDV